MKRSTLRTCLTLIWGIFLLLVVSWLWERSLVFAPAYAQGVVRYVALTGSDGSNNCNVATTPCRTIQRAIDVAANGDEIRIAAGIYDDVRVTAGLTQVVYITKTVTLRGGYTTSNWNTSSPDVNPTTLDAGGQGRVVYIAGSVSPALEGLRFTNGVASAAPRPGGGGIYVVTATVGITQCQIFSNVANFSSSSAGGGGLYLYKGNVTLSHSKVFSNATSRSGGGLYVEGLQEAQGCSFNLTLADNDIFSNAALLSGGGVYLYGFNASITNNNIFTNTALSDGTTFEGQGGGISLINGGNITVSNNQVYSNAASYKGGGFYISRNINSLLTDNQIFANETLDSDPVSPMIFYGGGGICIDGLSASPFPNGRITFSENSVFANISASEGGGMWVSNLPAGQSAFTNTVLVDNQVATGASGSGLFLFNSSPQMWHTTVARNGGGSGAGVYFYGSKGGPATLINSIVASQTTGLLLTTNGSIVAAADADGVLWFDNVQNTHTDGTAIITVTHEYTGDTAFVAPASGDYHLRASSEAIDKGIDAGVGIDRDGYPRSNPPDLGAYEYKGPVSALAIRKTGYPDPVQPGGVLTYTVSLTNAGDVTLNVTVTDTLPSGVISNTGYITWTTTLTNSGDTWATQFTVTVSADYTGALTNVVNATAVGGETAIYTATTQAKYEDEEERVFLPFVVKKL